MNKPIPTAEHVEARIIAALDKLCANIDQLLDTKDELLAAAKGVIETEAYGVQGSQELTHAIRKLRTVVEKIEAVK